LIIANQSSDGPALSGFADIHLLHDAIPELGIEDINLKVTFLGRDVNYPLIINAITGGTEQAGEVNRCLAAIASKYGLAMAVGSQTIAIENPKLRDSFSVTRELNPDGIILANVSAASCIGDVIEAVKMINADGIQLHFNVPQELAMLEGDRCFKGIIDNVARLVDKCSVPIIAKEVGFGLSREVVKKLYDAGVRIFDISGKGGTNFVVIEDQRQGNFARELDDWGISTANSLAEVVSTKLPITIIASGGIRKASDIAKALAIGADITAMAAPFLKTLLQDGFEELDRQVAEFLYILKSVFIMTGSQNCKQLREKPVIITGETNQWLTVRGINPQKWAHK
jgi:isopentenyl-diphosphate delta-isomerase